MRKLVILTVLGAFLAVLPEAAADTIRFVDGRKPQQNVEVMNETLDSIEYRLAGVRQTQKYPSAKVLDVVYTRTPDDYQVATDNFDVGAYQDAADLFLVAAQDSRRQKGLAAKCIYQAGDALMRAGLFSDAVSTFEKLESSHADSRYIPEAALGTGLAHLRGGSASKAKASFSKLKSNSSKYGERWGYEADLQLQMLSESKDPATALTTYRRLAKETQSKYPTVANQAKLRIGRVLISSKQFDEAESFFRTILEARTVSAPDVVAGAYNGLGTSLRNKPGAGDKELREALYAHLRVIVSFEGVVSELPEALYGAGKCFQKVPVEDAANRSRRMLGRVINEFGNSSWAAKAKQG